MKILQIFNRYTFIGGEEIAVAQISAELAANHEFRAVTLDSGEWAAETGLFCRVRQFLAMAWNPKSIRAVRDQIENFQPDIVLLHNLMPVGSAGLSVYLMRCGVPVIQFVHNFRPFSVNGYCWGNGRLLPQGLQKNFLPEILAGAWQNSRIKTAWYGVLIALLHCFGVYRQMDGWIAISEFMKKAFVEGGIDKNRIEVISHSWVPQCTDDELVSLAAAEDEPMFLFLGRLTEEKGLRVLLDAWELFEQSTAKGRLMIAGDGPLVEEVKSRCAKLQRADYLGFKTGEAKKQLLRRCTALVVPSIWWEPLGLVLYEAYDYGKPVLAARSGGIVDHVKDGVTGWLHDPGDFVLLASQMRQAILAPARCRERGMNGRELLLERNQGVWIKEFNDFIERIIATRHNQVAVEAPNRQPIKIQNSKPEITISVYLADQNPKLGRSLGISRMTEVMLDSLSQREDLRLCGIASESSIQMPKQTESRVLPWSTRGSVRRVLTDHLHPLIGNDSAVDVHYFPKGFLPRLQWLCQPSVVTIHDTIIQYYSDHYPEWRTDIEYHYWAAMLKHTLRHATCILTVSESAKTQITTFMERHGIPRKDIHVTYEPCMYESSPQLENPAKDNYVLHLGSREPHKRTAWLIQVWAKESQQNQALPALHVVGTIPVEVETLAQNSKNIVCLPFLDDEALQMKFSAARALILPSEIEGFGLPAIEAYYLGTPVCYTRGTSIEEVLEVATPHGGFSLDDPTSLFAALSDVLHVSPEEIYDCGLKLRETYAAEKVADRMVEAFRSVAAG
jgi:glycosyltransferase involved in cell wall biosynthesis